MVATKSGKKKKKAKPVKPVKTGRPEIKVDPKQVRQLASIGCTYPEIAAVVGCNERTLHRRFVSVIKEGKERLKASLRRWQYTSAQGGNVTMQIWLGKQLLGQKDRQEVSGEIIGLNIYLPKKDEK